MEYKYLSNAEIDLKLRELELEHQSIKEAILRLMDKMDAIEKEYSIVSQELKHRK